MLRIVAKIVRETGECSRNRSKEDGGVWFGMAGWWGGDLMGKTPGETQRWGKPLGQFASISIISIETRVDWQRSQRSVIKPGKHKCVSVALQDSLLECSAAIFHSALEPCSCRSALLSSQDFPTHFKSSILPLPSVVFPLPIDQSSSRHYLTRCSRPLSDQTCQTLFKNIS